MDRRSLLSVAALSIAGAGMGHVLAQGKPEKAKVVIAVGAKSSFQYLPLTIAERLGYFTAEGVEVEITEYGAGARALQAVQEGLADVAGGAFEQTIAAQGNKQFLKAFVLLGRAPQVAFGVSNRTMAGYRNIADLKGRKIGVSMPGSTTHLVAGMALVRAGLSTDDVSFVEIGPAAAAVAAVRSGQVDAMSHTEPVMTMLEHKSDVRIISDTRSLKGSQEVFGGPMPAACLFAPDAYLQKHPNTAQALANALVHALKWLQTAGPSDLIKVVPEAYLLGDRSLYLAAFAKIRETMAVDGLVSEEGARTALRALGRVGDIAKNLKIDLPRTFTNDFARRAKEKYLA